MDDEDFTESNIEDMESDSEVETSMAIDYWFGKMYLKCTIAEEVLREPSDTKSLESADEVRTRYCKDIRIQSSRIEEPHEETSSQRSRL